MQRNTPMTDADLMAVAPSIFASEPWHRMSDRYAFIPTIDIVRKMRTEGFEPFSAQQGRTRIEGKAEFTKHIIRFRDVRNGDGAALESLGSVTPELVLLNSHDGASSYKLMGGCFRLVCTNGLIIADSTMGKQISVRHSGNPDGIIEASYEVVEQFPRVMATIEEFGALQLTAPQQIAFAEAALTLKYDDETPAPINAAQLLRPARREDVAPTLWNTFNTVQEHMVRGGLRGRNSATRRRVTTREVTGISENTKINQALWMLTERMAQLTA